MTGRGELLLCLLSLFSGILGADQKFTFNQRVNHFSFLDQRTYKQRYTVDAEGWSLGNPIFIFLSGEAAMEFFEFQEVEGRLDAKRFGAQWIVLEHRFYGQSIPVVGNSAPYSIDGLQYLSSQQALADAAHFIDSYSRDQQLPPETRWVVWGCSYSGALSSWFRLKYPQLVIGSIAPSGPVYAQTNYSYNGWFQKVAPPECVFNVKAAIGRVLADLQTQNGRNQLQQAFNSCTPFSPNLQENWNFLWQLTEGIAGSIQFHNPPAWPMNQTCQLMGQSGYAAENWQQVLLAQGAATTGQCTDFTVKGMVNPLTNTSDSDRSWWWQKCTEFGFFKPSYGGDIFFPGLIPLENIVGLCQQIFGIQGMTPDVDFTNAYYGGYELAGSNILFTNGYYDPWHLLSINQDIGNVKAVTYAAGHCAPMTAVTNQDPQSLTAARTAMYEFLVGILAQ